MVGPNSRSVWAFMIPFDSSVVNVAIPSIGNEFGGELALLTWIPLATLLSLTSLVLVFGRLADLKGRRLFYGAGIITVSSASIICALSTSIYQLIIARAILGIGASMISGNSIAFITSTFPAQERGRALGIHTQLLFMPAHRLGPTLGGAPHQSLRLEVGIQHKRPTRDNRSDSIDKSW